MMKHRRLTDKEREYCRIRGEQNLSPYDAYEKAGYSVKSNNVGARLRDMERQPHIMGEIDRFANRPLRKLTEPKRPAQEVAEKAKELHKEVMAPKKAKKMSKDEIEIELSELHVQALAVGDLSTARQCLVDLGKDKGMFTPVQKIRFETIDDLTLEDTDALIARLMAANAATPAVSQDGEEQPAAVVQ